MSAFSHTCTLTQNPRLSIVLSKDLRLGTRTHQKEQRVGRGAALRCSIVKCGASHPLTALCLAGRHHHCHQQSRWQLGRGQAGRQSGHLPRAVCGGGYSPGMGLQCGEGGGRAWAAGRALTAALWTQIMLLWCSCRVGVWHQQEFLETELTLIITIITANTSLWLFYKRAAVERPV